MENKKVLIERFKTTKPLVYTEGTVTERGGKKLGSLEGIGASWAEATRNGRKYTRELWEKVMQSEDFQEMMDSMTCFGENDHPTEQSERIDSSLKEVSCVLTDMQLIDEEQVVWCKFDILDTPQGRILKSLVDYGCSLGVSSRGLGEEIVRDGETIIDPDTYSFFGFDVVVTPACKIARPAATESVNAKAKSVVESFKREIENAKTFDEVENIKNLAESVNLPNMDIITEAVEQKLNAKPDSEEDNIYIAKLEKQIESYVEQIKELKKQGKVIVNAYNENNMLLKESNQKLANSEKSNAKLQSQVHESKTTISSLRREKVKSDCLIAERSEETVSLNENIDTLDFKNERLNAKMQRLNGEIRSLENKLKEKEKTELELNDKISALNESIRDMSVHEKMLDVESDKSEKLLCKLEDKYNKLKSDYNDIKDINSVLNEKVNYLNELLAEKSRELTQKDNSLSEMKKHLEESKQQKKLTEQKLISNSKSEVKKVQNTLATTIDKYLEAKCIMEDIDVNYLKNLLPKNYTTEDVDKKVSEIVGNRVRFNNLPFSTNSIRTGTINLQETKKLSEEDL